MSDLGNKEIFARNLKYYMQLHEKDRNDICSILDIPYTTLSDWLNAKKYPRIDKIEMLANYFNIEKSDLIERKNRDNFDELDILFDKNKDILTESDKNIMKAIITERRKQIDKELGENDER